MAKGLFFFCCSCCILLLTIVNFSIGPITTGTVKRFFDEGNWGTLNCEYLKDLWDEAKDNNQRTDDQIKYGEGFGMNKKTAEKQAAKSAYTKFVNWN